MPLREGEMPIDRDKKSFNMAIKRIEKAMARKHTHCFFTGLPLIKSDTVEHLLPRAILKNHSFRVRRTLVKKANIIVMANSRINNLVGNAPLKVKFAIRDMLRGVLETNPELLLTDRKTRDNVLCRLCKQFMQDLYGFEIITTKRKVIFPWDWRAGTIPTATRIVLIERYLDLLTEEEILCMDFREMMEVVERYY